MKSQLKTGALISYFNMALNMLISIFLTPFLISSLGDSEYGVYKVMQSFAGQLSILSFGVSALVVRNIVYYNTRKEQREKENFMFIALFITYILATLILLVGVGMFFMVEPILGNSLSYEEVSLAKQLLILLVVNVSVSVVADSYNGIILAYERFGIKNGMQTLRLVLRVVFLIFLLKCGVKAIGVAVVDLSLSVFTLLFAIIYNKIKLKEKAKFYYWDFGMLKTCISFSLSIFLQAIVNQVNQNVDSIILGAMTGASTVTLYSLALTLYTSFNSIVSVISDMVGPKATRLVANGNYGEELTDFVIVHGRLQFMIAGLVITGFVLFGKNFLEIWMGNKYLDAYKITLILIIPVVIPLIQGATTAILNAMLKMSVRSMILFFMCIINVLVSIIMVKFWGYIGAAYGTALSLIIGHGILLNVYLSRKIHLNIKKMFKGIFRGVFFAILFSLLIGLPLIFIPNTLGGFLIKVCVYSIIYVIVLYFVGMNNAEKIYVRQFFDFLKKKQK